MKIRTVSVALLVYAMGCSNEPLTSPDIEPSLARGSGGGGGKPVTPGIAAVQLGDLKQLGCSGTAANVINDAVSAVIGGHCSRASLSPFIWSAGVGTIIPDTGVVRAVALDGTVFGELDFIPFYRRPGMNPVHLPLPADVTGGSIEAASAGGNLLVGSVSWQVGTSGYGRPGMWTWNGSEWTFSEFPGNGTDITPNGSRIVGSSGGRATTWTLVGGVWSPQTLPDDGAYSSLANGVNQNGTVIVGERRVSLTSDPSVTYPEQVAWISDGAGGWSLKLLGGFNIREGSAKAVATQGDGSIVAVGRAWEDLSGGGEQLWAVAWRLRAGATEFDAPTRLNPLVKGMTAAANDINSRGEIVGYSYTRTAMVAVKWTLQ